jgi:hypothetical protein
VPRAQNAFNEDGRLTDTKAEQKLLDVISDFVLHVGNHHPLPTRGNAQKPLAYLPAWSFWLMHSTSSLA